jgi:Raf kinase inhibitor-like YbhB/YbcL family protein
MNAAQATSTGSSRPTITVTSPDFADGATIPEQYTCRGAGTFPSLAWRGVPAEATSVALTVLDPDAPRGTFVHWVLYDLPAGDGGLTSGTVPAGASEGTNSGGRSGWYPPCPPSGQHHYVFTVHALTAPVAGSGQAVLDEIRRGAVAHGTLTGLVAAR